MSKNFLLALSVLILTIYISFPNLMRFTANQLTYEHPINNPEAIVVLSGASSERVTKATKLYHKGIANTIIMTGGKQFLTSDAELMKQYAVSLGVSPNHIILETNSQSTLDHPKMLNPILTQHNISSILIVTSKFHTRRSFSTFNSYLKESIDIGITGAPDGVNYNDWWKDHEMIEKIAIELLKTFYYLLKY